MPRTNELPLYSVAEFNDKVLKFAVIRLSMRRASPRALRSPKKGAAAQFAWACHSCQIHTCVLARPAERRSPPGWETAFFSLPLTPFLSIVALTLVFCLPACLLSK